MSYSNVVRFAGLVLALAAVLTLAAIAYLKATGLSARAEAGRMETALARVARRLAIPGEMRDRTNPLPASEEMVAEGLAHFADHCASCHGNDGSGDTDYGRGLFPKPPDMRQAETQELSDGELFYIIEHGVRFTGMPAFGTGELEGETSTWQLVQFIRRLPRVTPAELERMAQLNPRSVEEVRQELAEERFLQGGEP